MILVDTSALFALVQRDDRCHERAAAYVRGLPGPEELATHNYAVLELTALVQRRLGLQAVRDLVDGMLSSLDVLWVTREIHDAAVSAMLSATRRRASLVDWVSFEVMRREGMETAFAFDRDFARQGFRVVP